MKFRTRLIIAFVTVILLPIALSTGAIFLVGQYQLNVIEETYEITEASV